MAKLGAGVRKRADGSLEKRFTVNKVRYSVYGCNTKEIAEKEQELREQIKLGLYKNNANITLDSYVKEWKNRKRDYNKQNSIKTYNAMYTKHISPVLGKKKVCNIERRECLELQSRLKKNKSIETANYVLIVLNIILNDAIKDEIIVKNPCFGIKPIKKQKKKAVDTIHRALTEQEQELFMSESKNSFYYELFAFLLTTGVRSGEAISLTWNDIDYKNNVIHIRKTLTWTEEGKATVGTTKTESGTRDIPLNDTIKSILKEQKKKQLMMFGNISSINNLVFNTVWGKMLKGDCINVNIEYVLKALEEKGTPIKRFTAHAFRDTFATRYIEQGGSPQTLKTILGHSSLAMTMDLYSHVLPNTKQEEMDRIKISI